MFWIIIISWIKDGKKEEEEEAFSNNRSGGVVNNNNSNLNGGTNYDNNVQNMTSVTRTRKIALEVPGFTS